MYIPIEIFIIAYFTGGYLSWNAVQKRIGKRFRFDRVTFIIVLVFYPVIWIVAAALVCHEKLFVKGGVSMGYRIPPPYPGQPKEEYREELLRLQARQVKVVASVVPVVGIFVVVVGILYGLGIIGLPF